MLRINLKFLFIFCILFCHNTFAFFDDLPSDIGIANNLTKIEKYILSNESGLKHEMIRAYSEVSLIITELQTSCFQLKGHTYLLLDNICRGIGSVSFEAMVRQNYFIQSYQNLRIYILPMDPPLETSREIIADVNLQRYLFFNLIDWVSLNHTQKRIQVLLELMNFKDVENDTDRYAAASAIYYGLQSAETELTIATNTEQQPGTETFYFQQDDKLYFSSTSANDSKTNVYLGHRKMIRFQLQGCAAYKDYPNSIRNGIDYQFANTEICQNLSPIENVPLLLSANHTSSAAIKQITFSEKMKILLRCRN